MGARILATVNQHSSATNDGFSSWSSDAVNRCSVGDDLTLVDNFVYGQLSPGAAAAGIEMQDDVKQTDINCNGQRYLYQCNFFIINDLDTIGYIFRLPF